MSIALCTSLRRKQDLLNPQVLGMTVVTMVFAVFGFLSPSNRGALMTAMIILFTLMGIVAGLVSSRLYKVSPR